MAVAPAAVRRDGRVQAAGHPAEVDYRPSFVDGSGSKALLPQMWERARGPLTGAFALSLASLFRDGGEQTSVAASIVAFYASARGLQDGDVMLFRFSQ